VVSIPVLRTLTILPVRDSGWKLAEVGVPEPPVRGQHEREGIPKSLGITEPD
jgi:hypothetical protein